MPLLPPEARLLFLATRPGINPTDPELTGLIAAGPNWAVVGALAEREKLLPVLWSRIRQHAASIPTEAAVLFQRQAAVTEFRMAVTESLLIDVVGQLAQDGIRVMLLKGAALAKTVYPSFAQRPMGDLDLLVAPQDAERAWTRIRDAGWTLEWEEGEVFYKTHQHLPPLLAPKNLGIVLEIHRAILPPQAPFTLDEGAVWEEAQSVKLGITEAWAPSDRYQLLHLCIHYAWSHTLGRGVARAVRDVATLLEVRSIDWDAFVDLATKTRASTCAFWTLTLSKTLAGARVPGKALAELRPKQPDLINHLLERVYVMSSLSVGCPSLRLTQALWVAGIRPKTSGHGRALPWAVEELFHQAKHTPQVRVMNRIRSQLQAIGAWFRFAWILGSPRRLL